MNIFKKEPETAVCIEEKEEQKVEKTISPISLKKQFSTRRSRTKFITRVSMFGALSFIFYSFIKLPPLPFFPAFLEVKFNVLFLLIGTLSTGPLGGLIIEAITIITDIVFTGTSTQYVGELNDFILHTLIMLPAGFIYLKNHTKMGGFFAILSSFITWIVVSFFLNWFVSLPFYIKLFFKGDVQKMVDILKPTLPMVTTNNFVRVYLFGAVLPFNLLVGFFNTGLAFLVYKKISSLMMKIGV